MAMIKCQECGKEISSTAENCPHCGYRTQHGRSVSEAKGYLVWWVFAVAALVIGAILFFSNLGDFVDRADYLDRFKYFSDEGQACVIKFFLGLGFIIAGLVDIIVIGYRIKQMGQSGSNGYYSRNTEGGLRSDFYNHTPAPKMPTQSQDYIPAWKRVEMMEAEKVAKEKAEDLLKCSFCGAQMQEGQVFCGFCGEKKRNGQQ